MSVVGSFLFGCLRAALFAAIGKGVLMVLNDRGYCLECRIAEGLNLAVDAANTEGIQWILAGTLGLLCAIAWEVWRRKKTNRPSGKAANADKGALGAGNEMQRPSPGFDIQFDPTHRETNGYEYVFSIKIKNITSQKIEDCIVKLEEADWVWPRDMPRKLALRTEGQIDGKREGRFWLSPGEGKRVPILFRNTNRNNEWFLFDERGNHYFVPSGGYKLVIGAYGGHIGQKSLVTIRIREDWQVNLSIEAVESNFTLAKAGTAQSVATESRFAKLQSYFIHMQGQAKAISEGGNATNKSVMDWRDRCAKAIRTSLGPDKEREFCECENMTAAIMYPSPQGAKAAIDKYIATLQRISGHSTSYDLVESYDPSDLDQYR